jgi:5,10-methylenetetrahydromethanopterin reductase
MKVGVRVPASAPIKEVVALARRAEAAGVSHVWFPDSHLNYREVWTVLGAVAASTDRIGLSPSVTNLATRHPSVTASAARSLYEMCGDRFVLGVGAGDSAIGYGGLAHSRTSDLRTGIEILRRWMSGESAADSDQIRMRHGATPARIYLAASGPRNLKLGGEVADGVITPMTPSPKLEEKLATVADAASRAGRSECPEITVLAQSVPMDNLDRDVMLLSPLVVRFAQLEGVAMFEQAGVEVSPPDHLVGALGDLGHPDDLANFAAVASEFVSSEAAAFFAHNCTVSGTPEDMVNTLRRLEAAGVGRVNLATPVGLPEELIEVLGSEVLPKLRAND